MDSLPPGHHPDWRTSVLLLIWGTASPEGFLGAGGSCLPRYAGAPPRAPLLDNARRANALLCAPPKWGLRPHDPYGEGAPPLQPRVTFPSRGKSPKARQGLRPLESPGARFSPFSRSLTHRAGLVSATEKDRFATLRWWANRSLLFPLALTKRNILLLIRGSAGD